MNNCVISTRCGAQRAFESRCLQGQMRPTVKVKVPPPTHSCTSAPFFFLFFLSTMGVRKKNDEDKLLSIACNYWALFFLFFSFFVGPELVNVISRWWTGPVGNCFRFDHPSNVEEEMTWIIYNWSKNEAFIMWIYFSSKYSCLKNIDNATGSLSQYSKLILIFEALTFEKYYNVEAEFIITNWLFWFNID